MKRIGTLFVTLALVSASVAQPPARVREQAQRAGEQKQQAVSESERAALEFPVQAEMPADVVWRRDIYRSLDLMNDRNACLYYPLEQKGDQINLFTYLFKLVLRGKIPAYDYRLDGDENFDAANRVKGKDILDRYHIFYELKDGRMRINDSDLPAAEVTMYYIKESSYYDQRTATYRTQVVALCPVMKRADEFGGTATPYPMFWIKYDDAAPYLAKLPLSGSNLNNAATMSADDYFTMNRYEGKIYKTNNLQGRVLANYATTDSAMTREQNRIEAQLASFERHIWGNDSVSAPKPAADSSAVATTAKKPARAAERRTGSRRRASTTAKKERTSRSSGGGAPRVSVRRERH